MTVSGSIERSTAVRSTSIRVGASMDGPDAVASDARILAASAEVFIPSSVGASPGRAMGRWSPLRGRRTLQWPGRGAGADRAGAATIDAGPPDRDRAPFGVFGRPIPAGEA
jgi:hypothetical protein